MSDFAPETMSFHARHDGLSPEALLDIYAPRISDLVNFSLIGMATIENGALAAVKARLAKAKDVSAVTLEDADGSDLWLTEDDEDGSWRVRISRG